MNGRRIDYGYDTLDHEAKDEEKGIAKRVLSEAVQMHQIHNYHQNMLQPNGIYLLDYESVCFIWVGKNVPSSVVAQSFDMAIEALRALSCKGDNRLKKMSFNLVFYGFEPEVFKTAFKKGWTRLDQPKFEESKAIAKDESEDSEGGKPKPVRKVELSKEQLEKAGITLISDAYWIN